MTESFIDNYKWFISTIANTTEESSRAMLQFLISHALSNAEYRNSKGPISANLSFIWVSPSGSNKTPLIDNGIRKLRDTFPEFRLYGELTGKGFRQSLAKIKDPIVKALILWDEFGVGIKTSKNSGTSDLFEVFSMAFDGQLIPYDSVRSGAEKYPPIYANFWLSGVPDILMHTDKSFWYQGFGLRSLFLKYEFPERNEPIFDDEENIAQAEINFESMRVDLGKMKHIQKIRTMDEFMIKYNEYRDKILKEIQAVQKDIISSQDPANFSIISRAKFPVLVMKLSMIYAASRYNFAEEILTLEPEDLQTAIADLESYHKNMVEMFDVWQELVETKSRIDNIKNVKDKIKRHINTIIANGKSFILTEREDDGVKEYLASMSAEGKWVPHSALLRNSNLTSRKFAEIIETLTDQIMIAKRDGIIEKNGVKHVITFYSLT